MSVAGHRVNRKSQRRLICKGSGRRSCRVRQEHAKGGILVEACTPRDKLSAALELARSTGTRGGRHRGIAEHARALVAGRDVLGPFLNTY